MPPSGHQQVRAINPIDYLIVFWCINLSGNLAFISAGRQEPLLVLTALALMVRLISHSLLTNKAILAIAVFNAVIFTYQTIQTEFFAGVTIAGFYVRLVIAAATVATVSAFRFIYVRLMVWTVLLSLIFYVPAVMLGMVGVDIADIFRPLAKIMGAESQGVNERINILVHNFMSGEHKFRNSGIFWEPGAFSGYLTLALILLATIHNKLPQKIVTRWAAILTLGICTTLSTTGIICLPLAWMTFKIFKFEEGKDVRKEVQWIPVVLLIMIPVGLYVWNLEHVGPKIIELYERAVQKEAGWELSRIGSVIFDWEYIRANPLFGWGQNNTTQFSLHDGFTDFRLGNGFTGYIRQLGLLGMGLLIISTYAGLRILKVPAFTSFWTILVICVLLNGQYFLNYPIFNALYFIGLERRFSRVVRATTRPAPGLTRIEGSNPGNAGASKDRQELS